MTMTGPDADARARVRAYLLEQGRKHRWADLWPRVTAARLDLLQAARGVTAEQAAFSPGPEEWSIAQITRHAVQASRGVAAAVEHLARGEAPPSRAEGPEVPDGWEAVTEALLQDSVAWGARVVTLPEPPSFEAMSEHPFFGQLHARAWYLFQRVHDQDHTQQIAAVKAASGYPA